MLAQCRITTAKAVRAALLAAALTLAGTGAAAAQMRIAQDGWEGFVTPATGEAPARCVLYNRSIDAINASPYEMIGLAQDAAGKLSMLVFLVPNSLVRGPRVPVTVKLDQLTLYLTGDAVSDFHLLIPGPFETRALQLLREARVIEIAVQRHTERFEVAHLGPVLDKLAACAQTLAPPTP